MSLPLQGLLLHNYMINEYQTEKTSKKQKHIYFPNEADCICHKYFQLIHWLVSMP